MQKNTMKLMKLLITGGSGFLGRALTQHFMAMGTQVTWVSRDGATPHPEGVALMTYAQLRESKHSFEAIVNLAGAGIADKRWSEARKKVLYDSRLEPTQAILDYIQRVSVKPKCFISSSAIGWYGIQDKTPLTEQSTFRDDFLHQLCQAWEQRAKQAETLGVPTTIIRTGIVIATDGGMIERLLLPFKWGLGGKLGDGKQIVSWISRDDWLRAVQFIIDKSLSDSRAPRLYNLTCPAPVSNAAFTRSLGKWLKRPTHFSLPRVLLEQRFGEMATLLVDGQTVLPQALLDAGFEFLQPTIMEALNA